MDYLAKLLGAVLKNVYFFTGNYGLSIIVFTIFIKILLLPLAIKQTKSMREISDINPKIKEIQEKHKKNPEKQNQEIAKLYKEKGVNPISGCLPLIIQMPILITLFWVFREPLKYGVFDSMMQMTAAKTSFLWVVSLDKPDYILAVISGISTYLMQKQTVQKDQLNGVNNIMNIIMPIMSLIWGFTLPSALTLYWSVGNIVSMIQNRFILNPKKKS